MAFAGSSVATVGGIGAILVGTAFLSPLVSIGGSARRSASHDHPSVLFFVRVLRADRQAFVRSRAPFGPFLCRRIVTICERPFEGCAKGRLDAAARQVEQLAIAFPAGPSEWSANRLFRNLPSHRKYQRRILPVVLIAETERQRLWRARGIILAKIWLVEVFEQIDWSGVGTKEP